MMMTGKLLLATVAVAALSSGAMAADLSIPAAPAPAAVAPATTNWDGPYIGANIGYGWASADETDITPGFDTSPSGFLIGAQLGYNFHLSDNIVAGVEGNIDWSNESATVASGFGGVTQKINWDGNVVAKLGFDVDGILPYVDAGVAFANATRSSVAGSGSNTQTGWTVGVGVEGMIADNLSAFVSYNYADYGTATYTLGGFTPAVHLTDNIVKVGLNYHF